MVSLIVKISDSNIVHTYILHHAKNGAISASIRLISTDEYSIGTNSITFNSNYHHKKSVVRVDSRPKAFLIQTGSLLNNGRKQILISAWNGRCTVLVYDWNGRTLHLIFKHNDGRTDCRIICYNKHYYMVEYVPKNQYEFSSCSGRWYNLQKYNLEVRLLYWKNSHFVPVFIKLFHENSRYFMKQFNIENKWTK